MSKLDTILSEITGLAGDDLVKVQAAISALAPDQASAKVSDAMAIVWPLFVESARSRGVSLPPMSIIARHRSYPTLKMGAAGLLTFAEEFKPVNRLERQAAIEFCVEAMLRWIAARLPNAPTSVRVIAQQLPYIGDAVDAQLPGYQASGLLHVVLRGLKKGKAKAV